VQQRCILREITLDLIYCSFKSTYLFFYLRPSSLYKVSVKVLSQIHAGELIDNHSQLGVIPAYFRNKPGQE